MQKHICGSQVNCRGFIHSGGLLHTGHSTNNSRMPTSQNSCTAILLWHASCGTERLRGLTAVLMSGSLTTYTGCLQPEPDPAKQDCSDRAFEPAWANTTDVHVKRIMLLQRMWSRKASCKA